MMARWQLSRMAHLYLMVMQVSGPSEIRRYLIENDWLDADCAVAE